MQIHVSCFATLSRYTPPEGRLEVEEGATLQEVIDLLSIPREEVRITFINGRNSEKTAGLKANDRVGIFPAIGGG